MKLDMHWCEPAVCETLAAVRKSQGMSTRDEYPNGCFVFVHDTPDATIAYNNTDGKR